MASLAVLATLIALLCAEEHWRGKRAWQKYKHALEAQGEKLDWKDFIPPPVPDDQNFATTPFLAPLFDFNPRPLKEGESPWRDTNAFHRTSSLGGELVKLEDSLGWRSSYHTVQRMTDLQGWARALTGRTNDNPTAAASAANDPAAAAEVLRALEAYSSVLEELRNASLRPYARFNIRYEDDFAFNILLPHLAVLKNLSSLFRLRASAELAVNQTDQAWADAKIVFYLADTLKNEPFLISRLVQAAIVQQALQPVWEGLAEHKWSDTQLLEIQQRLGQLDLLADAAQRGERALCLLAVEQLRQTGSMSPDDPRGPGRFAVFPLGGLFYQNERFIARMYQQFLIPVVDDAGQRIYPAQATANEEALTQAMSGGLAPYRFLARMLLPAVVRAETKFGFGQTRVNEAIVACALERYRLAEGRFPESLEALAPRFLQKLPNDLVTGAPLKYRLAGDKRFVLYSVGWNEKDDGGTVPLTRAAKPTTDLTQGDWIWQYPAPAEKEIKPTASAPVSRGP